MVINDRGNLDNKTAPWIGLSELFLSKRKTSEKEILLSVSFLSRGFLFKKGSFEPIYPCGHWLSRLTLLLIQ